MSGSVDLQVAMRLDTQGTAATIEYNELRGGNVAAQ